MPRQAGAVVGVNLIIACSTILTGTAGTFINICNQKGKSHCSKSLDKYDHPLTSLLHVHQRKGGASGAKGT